VYERTLIDQLIDALRDIPGADVRHEQYADIAERDVDALIEMEIDGRPVTLIVEAKRSGFPRDVREVVWRLRDRLRGNARHDTVPIFASETVSPGAREVLRQERIGYFDESGSLFIPAPGAYVLIDRPMMKRQQRRLGSVFAGRRAQVVHAAWLVEDWFGVHELADRAKVSPATTSQTLIDMERRDWVEVRGSGPAKERRLSDRRALLDAWSDHQRSAKPAPAQHYYVPGGQVAQVIAKLDAAAEELDAEYEVTGPVAAQAYSPYLSRISQVQCRLSARADDLLARMDARAVNEGWNLSVIETVAPGDLAFRRRMDGAWMADPLQTYLDLLQGGGRSREFAEHLRQERLAA